jgi:hypothetical protein
MVSVASEGCEVRIAERGRSWKELVALDRAGRMCRSLGALASFQ